LDDSVWKIAPAVGAGFSILVAGNEKTIKEKEKPRVITFSKFPGSSKPTGSNNPKHFGGEQS